MKKIILLSILLAGVASMLSGCPNTTSHSRGVYMLLDTSGTYANELEKAQKIINYLLANLNPGDSLSVARIDSGSFSEKDIISKVTFDIRPSVANNQKRAFSKKIDDFVKNVKGSSYTDISGGLLQAIEFLDEAGPATKTILIFSDLEEDLAKGHVRDFPLQLNGFRVLALNVTKLRSDNVDPREYLNRLDLWRNKVEQGGGNWKVLNDLEKLDSVLSG